MIKVGFAEMDVTPPPGIEKAGWIKRIVSDRVDDPLFARAAVFDSGQQAVGFIQLDTLSVRWTQANDIRKRIEAQCGVPGRHIMVAATHNHAGPAIGNIGESRRDEGYIERLTQMCVRAFAQAWQARQDAEVGFGHTFEWDVAHNRRVVMRDGTVRTHANFNDPNALCLEGPIDPEVAVLAARHPGGTLLGCIVNYACHPTHKGDGTALSAGYPGVLAAEMKSHGCPVTLFLNGACGNTHTADPCKGGAGMSMEEAGRALARDALKVIASLAYERTPEIRAASRTVLLPYRAVTADEVAGKVRGAQRFVNPAVYDRLMPQLLERIRSRGTQPAEVQALSVGQTDWIGIPAEYFVEHQLRIKEAGWPRRSLVVGHANGMVGYVPTRAAFQRGGYETTFGFGYRLAPEAGDMLADMAIELIRR